jgi:hypothetical protein
MEGHVGRYLFMGAVIERIAQGVIFKRVFTALLLLVAGGVVVSGLVAFAEGWKLVSDLRGFQVLGGIAFELLLLVAIYMMAHTLIIRARHVRDLPEGEFVVVPIASILIRLTGEILAIMGIVMSVAFGVLMMFGADLRRFASDLPFLPPGVTSYAASFVSGLVSIAWGLTYSFTVLLIAYLLAELTVALVDVARNARQMREILERGTSEAAKVTAA